MSCDHKTGYDQLKDDYGRFTNGLLMGAVDLLGFLVHASLWLLGKVLPLSLLALGGGLFMMGRTEGSILAQGLGGVLIAFVLAMYEDKFLAFFNLNGEPTEKKS